MKLDSTRVRVLMAQLGITHTELAERAGITRQTLSAVMHGKSCTPRTVGKVAAGVEVADIVKEVG